MVTQTTNILTDKDFTGEYLVAGTDGSDVRQVLCGFIARHEPEFLRSALGYEFSKLFDTGRITDPIPARWALLLNGGEYKDKAGKLHYWSGIRTAIKGYIYFYYQRNLATQTTGVGEAKTKTENAVRVSPDRKLGRNWNETVDEVRQMHLLLLDAVDDSGNRLYPEYAPAVGISDCCKWVLRNIDHPINTFGI